MKRTQSCSRGGVHSTESDFSELKKIIYNELHTNIDNGLKNKKEDNLFLNNILLQGCEHLEQAAFLIKIYNDHNSNSSPSSTSATINLASLETSQNNDFHQKSSKSILSSSTKNQNNLAIDIKKRDTNNNEEKEDVNDDIDIEKANNTPDDISEFSKEEDQDDFTLKKDKNNTKNSKNNIKEATSSNLEKSSSDNKVSQSKDKKEHGSKKQSKQETYFTKACKIIWELSDDQRKKLVEQSMEIMTNSTKYDTIKDLKNSNKINENAKNTINNETYFYKLYYTRTFLIKFLKKATDKELSEVNNKKSPRRPYYNSLEECTTLKMCKFCHGISLGDICTTLFCPGPNDLPYNIYLDNKNDNDKDKNKDNDEAEEGEGEGEGEGESDENNSDDKKKQKDVESDGKNSNKTANKKKPTDQTKMQKDSVKSALMTKFVSLEEKNNYTLSHFLNLNAKNLILKTNGPIVANSSSLLSSSSSSIGDSSNTNIIVWNLMDNNLNKKDLPILYGNKCSSALRKSLVSKGCGMTQLVVLDWFIFPKMIPKHETNPKCPIHIHQNILFKNWYKESFFKSLLSSSASSSSVTDDKNNNNKETKSKTKQ